MKCSYNTGIDTNQINLGATVGTVGTAYTIVSFVKNGSQTPIAESNEDSGNIQERNIGNAIILRNNFLFIRTTIDLSNIDKSLWTNQSDNLVIRYLLNGGFSGNQVYQQDPDDIVTSPNGNKIVVTKLIQLI